MYHTTRAGDRVPIAMLTNEHLLNIINVHLERVSQAKRVLRTDVSEVTSLFMGKEAHQISRSTRQQAQHELMRFHERVSPYVMEANVRNLNVANLIAQLQQAVERKEGIPNPKPLRQIAGVQQTSPVCTRAPVTVDQYMDLPKLEDLLEEEEQELRDLLD